MVNVNRRRKQMRNLKRVVMLLATVSYSGQQMNFCHTKRLERVNFRSDRPNLNNSRTTWCVTRTVANTRWAQLYLARFQWLPVDVDSQFDSDENVIWALCYVQQVATSKTTTTRKPEINQHQRDDGSFRLQVAVMFAPDWKRQTNTLFSFRDGFFLVRYRVVRGWTKANAKVRAAAKAWSIAAISSFS